MSNSANQFARWRGWLARIYDDQLHDLLRNYHVFKQLQSCAGKDAGTRVGVELAEWMVQCYVAFAATAIRRVVEPPAAVAKAKQCPHCRQIVPPKPPREDKSVSLMILLEDLKAHSTLLTRQRFHDKTYKKQIPKSFAKRDFARIARNKRASCLSAKRIARDIEDLKRVTKPIRRLVNKVIAHTEWDRRKRGKLTYRQLGSAIEFIDDTFKRYSLLINGRSSDPSLDDVTDDLSKIWPWPTTTRC